MRRSRLAIPPGDLQVTDEALQIDDDGLSRSGIVVEEMARAGRNRLHSQPAGAARSNDEALGAVAGTGLEVPK